MYSSNTYSFYISELFPQLRHQKRVIEKKYKPNKRPRHRPLMQKKGLKPKKPGGPKISAFKSPFKKK